MGHATTNVLSTAARTDCLYCENSHAELWAATFSSCFLLLGGRIRLAGDHHALVYMLGEVRTVAHKLPCSASVVSDEVSFAVGDRFQASAHRYLKRMADSSPRTGSRLRVLSSTRLRGTRLTESEHYERKQFSYSFGAISHNSPPRVLRRFQKPPASRVPIKSHGQLIKKR